MRRELNKARIFANGIKGKSSVKKPDCCLLFALMMSAGMTQSQAAQAQRPEVSLEYGAKTEENGIRLERKAVEIATGDADGKTAWVSRHKSVAADEWARSFLLTITDPRFKNGKMPNVSVEIRFLHSANTAVEVKADSASGSEKVASAWGNNPKWQTLKFKMTNAYFGARDHKGKASDLPSDGYDLRINAWAGDFFLQSVRIVGQTADSPDWTQLLTSEGAESAGKFIVAPEKSDVVKFRVRNSAKKAANAIVKWDVLNPNGKSISTREDKIALAANALTNVPFSFDAKGLERGDYSVRGTVQVDRETVLALEQTMVVAGSQDIFIVFDKEPMMRGMSFDHEYFEPVQIEADGRKRWAWQTTGGASRGADPWWNSALFTITDPRFVKGGRPAVDVALTYRHTANAPVNLSADTIKGSRNIIEGWGNNSSWQTAYTQLDDAKFAQTNYNGNAKELPTDNFDLRFNANSGTGQVRSIFIRGYDLDKNPDYRRLLRYDGLNANRKIFLFKPGEKQPLSIKLRNVARVPMQAVYDVQLLDDMGQEIWKRTEKALVPKSSNFSLPIAFDTKGLKQGVYTFKVNLGRNDVGGKREALIAPQANVMVAEQSPIGKARDDEFWYGLDIINGTHTDEYYQWADFMGPDILRGVDGPNESANLKRALARIEPLKLKTQLFFDIPWDNDEATRDRKVNEQAARAETIAREFGPQIKYYELGNEPDLTFFYGGPMSTYVKGFEAVSRAIKRGDPDSVVMNGGLSFAGSEGDARSREFIKLVDSKTVDAIAYHGHGPGSQAERGAFNRVKDEAVKWGKGDIPFVETESGVSAATPVQIRVQARTAIQKMTYAQSAGVPMFQWFRLLIDGGDAGYTNLLNNQEPRSVILSYRTMTKTLKGLKYSRAVDLGASDAEAYLFIDNRGGNKRSLVLWTNGQGGGTRTLNLGGGAQSMKLTDMFGNALPVAKTSVVTVPLDNDPVFLSWNGGDVKTVASLPSMLQASASHVTLGGADTVSVTIKNPTNEPLQAVLTMKAGASSFVQPQAEAKKGMTLSIAPMGEKRVLIPVQVAATNNSIRWPQTWTLFSDLPRDVLKASNTLEIPSQLSLGGKTIKAQSVQLAGSELNIAPLGGGYGEKKEALLMAEVFSPSARKVLFGATADWYMQWFVNGKEVFNSLETGNQGSVSSVLDHQFEVSLKAGRNVVAVRALSGSQGWRIIMGGPDEVALAKGSGADSSVSVELSSGGAMLARAPLSLAPRRIISMSKADAPLASWNAIEPDGQLGERDVVNDWIKIPNQNDKWWQNSDDLSARVWARSTDKRINLLIAVRDDNHRIAPDASAIDTTDSVRVALADMDEKVVQWAVSSGGKVFQAQGGDTNWKPVENGLAAAQVERVGPSVGAGETWYRISLDRAALPVKSGTIALNIRINDDDMGGLKQFATIAGTDIASPKPDVSRWWQMLLL